MVTSLGDREGELAVVSLGFLNETVSLPRRCREDGERGAGGRGEEVSGKLQKGGKAGRGERGNEPWGRGRWGRYGTRTSTGRDQRGTRSEAEEGGWHGDGGGSGGRQRVNRASAQGGPGSGGYRSDLLHKECVK